MRKFLLWALAAVTLASVPAHADQILGQPRIDNSSRVQLPGGPTLGRWQGGKYIATPDTIQVKDPGSTGPIDTMTARGRSLAAHFSEVINAADPQYAGGVKPDCTAIGVGTDNGPALQAAVNAWVAAGPGTKLYVPYGRYRIATPVLANLNGQVGMVFDASDAQFTPDKTSIRVFDFRNGYSAIIKARLYEGGPFNGWDKTPVYPVDYSTVADVVGAGGQEAIRVTGILGYTVDLQAQNYAGRVLRVGRAQGSDPQTGAIKGRIHTSRGLAFDKPRTGQSVFSDNGNNGATGNWGQLDTLINDFDGYGPVWRDWFDVAVTYLDAGYAFQGVRLEGVENIHGATWYVGDIDANPNNTHLALVPSPITGKLSSGLTLGQLTMLNRGDGLFVQSTNAAHRAFDIESIRMVSAGPIDVGGGQIIDLTSGTAVILNGAYGASGKITAEGPVNTILSIINSNSDNIRLQTFGTGTVNNSVYIGASITGKIQLGGRITSPQNGLAALRVEGNTPLRLSDWEAYTATPGQVLMYLTSAQNKVRFVSGTISGGGTPYFPNNPAYVSPAVD